jgi:homoserine dehydrogenase
MRELRLALLGLGNVAQAFLKLLPQKISYFSSSNIRFKVVGVATRTRGAAIDPTDISPARLLDTIVNPYYASH